MSCGVNHARDEAAQKREPGKGSEFGPRAPGPQKLWPFVLIAVLAIAAVHVGVFFRDGLAVDRLLQDTDAYMWMNRASHLYETGGWFDHTYPRINPPDGHLQHWTRPMDILLLGGGALSGAILGFERGLYYWALVLTPLMHLLALLILVWGVQPLVRRNLLPLAGVPTLLLVFVAQMGAYQPFLMGRPDHHAPLALLFVAYLALMLRVLIDEREPVRWAIWMGCVGALAVWVNVEALVFVVLGLAGLGLSWLFGKVRMGRINAAHGASLFLTLTATWLIQWGPQALWVREMDTISVAHVAVFGLAMLFWTFLWWTSAAGLASDVRRRTAIGAMGAAGVLGATYLLFPAFFGDPLGGVDPLYRETRLLNIDELQPLTAGAVDYWAATGRLVVFAGIASASIFYLMARIFRHGDRDERVVWGVFAALIGFYLCMSLLQRRWTDYLALSAVIPFSLLAVATLHHLGTRLPARTWGVVRPLVLLALVFGPLLLGMSLGIASSEGPDEHGIPRLMEWQESDAVATISVLVPARDPARRTCDLARVAEVLRDPAWFFPPALILAHADHGPELLYRTDHHVLSIPNHRHQPGYAFTWQVLSDTDPQRATAALQERGVAAVLLCASDLTAGFLPMIHIEDSFLRYLARGGIPDGYTLHAETPYWRVYRRSS